MSLIQLISITQLPDVLLCRIVCNAIFIPKAHATNFEHNYMPRYKLSCFQIYGSCTND